MTRATPRPKKGTATRMRRARARLHHTIERAAKAAARERDGYRCRHCHVAGFVEAAHIRNKQMGGDHGLRSSERKDFVTLCADCHRGPTSVHSGDLKIVVGPNGGDGPVVFSEGYLSVIG